MFALPPSFDEYVQRVAVVSREVGCIGKVGNRKLNIDRMLASNVCTILPTPARRVTIMAKCQVD